MSAGTDDKGDLMDRLDQAIGRLADGAAPLDELVAAHEEAVRLLDQAEAELKVLRERADAVIQQLRA